MYSHIVVTILNPRFVVCAIFIIMTMPVPEHEGGVALSPRVDLVAIRLHHLGGRGARRAAEDGLAACFFSGWAGEAGFWKSGMHRAGDNNRTATISGERASTAYTTPQQQHPFRFKICKEDRVGHRPVNLSVHCSKGQKEMPGRRRYPSPPFRQ